MKHLLPVSFITLPRIFSGGTRKTVFGDRNRFSAKKIYTIFVLVFLNGYAFSQVTENFNRPSLSSGTLGCWRTYRSTLGGGSGGNNRAISPDAVPLPASPAFSLNDTTPINGSKSLHIEDTTYSFTYDDGSEIMYYYNYGTTDSLYSIAYGDDGTAVSFKLRISNLVLPSPESVFSVSVVCGDFVQTSSYTAADMGSTIPVSANISGSNGGGVITIQFYIIHSFNHPLNEASTTALFSADIDDFSTSASLDPDCGCLQILLPAGLTNFTADNTNCTALLKWTTASESNSQGFDIERSADGIAWHKIGFAPSKAVNGNSSAGISYYYTDGSPQQGANYYRLKQVDRDGKFQYSEARVVKFDADGAITVYPNPARGNIAISGLQDGQLIQLFGVNGQLIIEKKATGFREYFNLSGFAAGIYHITIKNQGGLLLESKLIKVDL